MLVMDVDLVDLVVYWFYGSGMVVDGRFIFLCR